MLTLHELFRMDHSGELKFKRIIPEQDVVLSNNSPSNNSKKGRFDFLVETLDGEFIGFEVLSRPSRGKLKEKLSYAEQCDRFVFVLPKNALEFYRKPKGKIFHKKARLKFFEKEFAAENLFAWILDTEKGAFTEKKRFSKIFNVGN